MDYETLKKEWLINSNWRAHIAKYIDLKRKFKGNYLPRQYCKEETINCEAFELWLEYLKKEDRYVFYISFATEYLNRSKRSLELLQKYIDVSELRMALIRDAIVAYAAPFTKSQSRVSTKFTLGDIEHLIPDDLKTIHRKILEERDTIVAHCDLKPRNPRMGLYGIAIRVAGHNWEDYKKFIPDFRKLVLNVLGNLHKYNNEEFHSIETYFKDFLNPPPCTSVDPGQPSESN